MEDEDLIVVLHHNTVPFSSMVRVFAVSVASEDVANQNHNRLYDGVSNI